MRRFLLIALPLGALALSGCGSHAKDEALGQACDRVNNALSSADMNRPTIAAFGASVAQWAQGGDGATKSALAPLVASANVYSTAPDAQRAATVEQFWREVKGLADVCRSNGTPMLPLRPPKDRS